MIGGGVGISGVVMMDGRQEERERREKGISLGRGWRSHIMYDSSRRESGHADDGRTVGPGARMKSREQRSHPATGSGAAEAVGMADDVGIEGGLDLLVEFGLGLVVELRVDLVVADDGLDGG